MGAPFKVFTITAKTFFYFQTDSYLSLMRLTLCVTIAITFTSFPTSPPGCTKLPRLNTKIQPGIFCIFTLLDANMRALTRPLFFRDVACRSNNGRELVKNALLFILVEIEDVFHFFALFFEHGKFIRAEQTHFAVLILSDDVEDFAFCYAYAGKQRF